ncbi:hypothetical protein ACO0QE_004437 [Hanseniaspora vineae]
MSNVAKDKILEQYKDCSIEELPSPSFLIDEQKFDANCSKMIESIKRLQESKLCSMSFRPHVKTHKTVEGTIKQLNNKFSKSILVSTLSEAEGLINDKRSAPLIDDICYTLPLTFDMSFMQRIVAIKRRTSLHIFVDNLAQLPYLKKFQSLLKDPEPWSVFVKIDVGTARAGIATGSTGFMELISAIHGDYSGVVSLYGFYAHCGHSYHVENVEEVYTDLAEELQGVVRSAQIYRKFSSEKLVLSIGSTPTMNALNDRPEIRELLRCIEQMGHTLEFHCGNYCFLDLQQVSTGMVKLEDISGFVLGTVVSKYEERKEFLINTGVTSLTREVSDGFPGFGVVCPMNIGKTQYYDTDKQFVVDRLSQEHGIVKSSGESLLDIATKVAVIPQHACITMNSFPYFFVFDPHTKKVVDVWVPLKGW